MTPASRRRALRLSAAALAGGFAGCLSDGRAPVDATGPPDHPPAAPRDAVAGAWPSHRFDATGRGHAADATGPAAPVGELWRVPHGDAASTPAVAGGTVYLAGEGLVARDAATGEERWRADLGRGFKSSPAVHDGSVFVGVDDALHAVDAATGEERWRHGMGSDEVTSPVVAGGTVLAGSGDSRYWRGAVHALAPASGAVRWTVEVADWLGTMPVAADGRVFFGGHDGNVLAVRLDDGREVWSRSVPDGLFHTFAVADGTLFVPDDGTRVHALDAATGERRWTAQVGRGDGGDGDGGDGDDTEDGDDAGDRPHATVSSPVAVDADRVYVGTTDGRLHAIDRETGREQWRFWTWNAVRSAPAVAGGTVYAGSLDANVYALDAETGAERWSFSTGERLSRATPAVADGVAYVNGGEHCFAVAAREDE